MNHVPNPLSNNGHSVHNVHSVHLSHDLMDLTLLSLQPLPDDPGRLALTLAGGCRHAPVLPRRCFPQSDPDHFISLLDAASGLAPLGIIADPGRLDPESRRALREALDRHYFTPEIRRIFSLREQRGLAYFHVLTGHGETSFTVQGIRENIIETRPGSYILTDIHGARYRLPATAALDRASRRLISRYV